MQLARIEGNVVATVKHPSLQGWRLLICQPLDSKDQPSGVPVIAVDPYGASLHQRVIVSTDGSATRKAVKDPKSPARNMIIGIVDELEEKNSEARSQKSE